MAFSDFLRTYPEEGRLGRMVIINHCVEYRESSLNGVDWVTLSEVTSKETSFTKG